MKAMILAAGLGTRLKPLTDHIPKALVEVAGVPMLERVIINLKSQGVGYIVVNIHHFGNQIREFLASRDFGVEIEISDESDELLDTGGGIVKASPMLFKYDTKPVLIHNVDILSNAPLGHLIKVAGDKTTLLISDRDSSRKLIFDSEMVLKGWHDLKNNVFRGNVSDYLENPGREYAFSGIYTMTYETVDEMRRIFGEKKYSIMDYFLSNERRLPVFGYEEIGLRLIDIGKPATLSQARDFI